MNIKKKQSLEGCGNYSYTLVTTMGAWSNYWYSYNHRNLNGCGHINEHHPLKGCGYVNEHNIP